MGLPKTYTLYLRACGDNLRFEPALCASDAEAMGRARTLLRTHPECEEIEVFFGEEHLFSVERGPS